MFGLSSNRLTGQRSSAIRPETTARSRICKIPVFGERRRSLCQSGILHPAVRRESEPGIPLSTRCQSPQTSSESSGLPGRTHTSGVPWQAGVGHRSVICPDGSRTGRARRPMNVFSQRMQMQDSSSEFHSRRVSTARRACSFSDEETLCVFILSASQIQCASVSFLNNQTGACLWTHEFPDKARRLESPLRPASGFPSTDKQA